MADSQDAIDLKRRARRRLLGAIALIVFVVIVLPIMLDREPKQVSQDLTIQIPSQDPAKFSSRLLPVQPDAASSAAEAAPLPQPALGTADRAATLESRLELNPAKAVTPDIKSDVRSGTKPDAKAEARTAVGFEPLPRDQAPREAIKDAIPAARVAKVETPAQKPVSSSTANGKANTANGAADGREPAKAGAAAVPGTDGKLARAQSPAWGRYDSPATASAADGKSASMSPVVPGGTGFSVPLGVFTKAKNINQIRSKAATAGFKTFTEPVTGSDRMRVRAGPFSSRDEAEKARDKLTSAGLTTGAVAAP